MTLLQPGTGRAIPISAVPNSYTARLLADVGAEAACLGGGLPDHPSERLAASGLMALTGRAGRSPVPCPVPLADCADACLEAFRVLSGCRVLETTRGGRLLAERAALSGSERNGPVSPGGSCRLLESKDGCVAINLARREDWELTPAWIQHDGSCDWDAVADSVAGLATGYLVERGRLLGLAVVDATTIPASGTGWLQVSHVGSAVREKRGTPRILDLSSLWAGPLCSHLWQQAGAEVIKVEGSRRPDGARAGPAEFFNLLNGGKQCLILDLHTVEGRRELLELARSVDIVLEGSRPRALRQMGIFAEELLASNPGMTWVSITGYGRREPEANWIAYGDDAGVAAGLSAILHQVTGDWLICGDAIADPLTGLHAALAGWASWLAGGGHLLDLALERTVRHCITATAPPDNDYRQRYAQWQRHLATHRMAALPPQCRSGGATSTP